MKHIRQTKTYSSLWKKQLTQNKLNHICKKYDINGVLLEVPHIDWQSGIFCYGVVWLNKVTSKSRIFIEQLLRNNYNIICESKFLSKYDIHNRNINYWLEKLKHYRNGTFVDWYLNDTIKNICKSTFYEYDENQVSGVVVKYANISNKLLLQLKIDSGCIEPYVYFKDGIKLYDVNPGSENDYSVAKIECQDEEGRCFDELTINNIHIFINDNFIKLKDISIEDLKLSFNRKIDSELNEKTYTIDIYENYSTYS